MFCETKERHDACYFLLIDANVFFCYNATLISDSTNKILYYPTTSKSVLALQCHRSGEGHRQLSTFRSSLNPSQAQGG